MDDSSELFQLNFIRLVLFLQEEELAFGCVIRRRNLLLS